MLYAATHKVDDGQRTSYNIALLTAKGSKAHTICQTLIAPVIREVKTAALKKDLQPVLGATSLSNSTVQSRTVFCICRIQYSMEAN